MKYFAVILCLILLDTKAQIISPFNKLAVNATNQKNYSFYVGGHFHGSSTNVSGFPAASLLANLDLLNADTTMFLISTGDLFLDVKNNIPNYEKSFFNKLKIPLFNAVGNHDISGDVYTSHYGKTWSSFQLGTEAFIILDAEINDGSIKDEQLDFFKSSLKKFTGTNSLVKNIFIFTHRPVWAEDDENLKNIFVDNTQSDFGNNFQSTVLPLLKKYSKTQKFYWFSGSLGASAPASFFTYNTKDNINFIQTAIRDLPRDGILKVKLNNAIVSFETVSFSDQKMPEFETCGLNMWKSAPTSTPFNYRLIPLYIKQMLFHRYFWYGLLIGILSFLSLRFVILKIKQKKIA